MLVTVSRTANPTTQERQEVLIEEARQNTAEKIREAREMADAKRYDDARSTIEDAKTNLSRNGLDTSHPTVKALTSELDQFLKLLETPEIYEKLGRAFALAAELAHALQRFAAKGNVNELRMFATKNMDQLLAQVKNYENDSTAPVSTAAQDAMQTQATANANVAQPAPPVNNPTVAMAEALTTHLGQAIQSLRDMQELINSIASGSI